LDLAFGGDEASHLFIGVGDEVAPTRFPLRELESLHMFDDGLR
jgi:hypothetical protein